MSSEAPRSFSSGPPDREVAALRVPPHSIEAEQSVLGGLLLDNQAFDRVADLLRDDDFYRHDHRLIWQQISRLIERSHPADVVTVFEALKTAGKIDEAGGLQYLNALAQETPSAANIRRYGEIVRDRAILRQLITTSDEIATQALNPQGKDTRQMLDEAESKIFQISEDGSRGTAGFQSLQDLLGKVVERVDELYSRGAGPAIWSSWPVVPRWARRSPTTPRCERPTAGSASMNGARAMRWRRSMVSPRRSPVSIRKASGRCSGCGFPMAAARSPAPSTCGASIIRAGARRGS